ncbi:DUF3553 domain-containing protein [Azospirillum sp. RWY-5-1]|uniref:DUF3553 domain-containing protein n=1 Tax=Azospirillum oleiclasticum TaxID=2735135 RepID=A0ABX2T261_9PROT|nr:DUF3553 domain-containing protein [Azospirillum oleiclasticum]NYZ10985.1 DUF3553 domain-containing protein [Azospirillum oleiclasticum]NYZ18147.1 DUF3553 domain-containing protein [Azospirillum oleiclasticum]
MDDTLVPGAYVRHPTRPDWGLGQVQSAIGPRVTVNFEHAGKVLVNTDVIVLDVVDPDEDPPGPEAVSPA